MNGGTLPEARVVAICRRIPGEGSRVGRFWHVPRRGGAIQVLLEGEDAGNWVNTSTGACGDLVDLAAMAPGLDDHAALAARAPGPTAGQGRDAHAGEPEPGAALSDLAVAGLAGVAILVPVLIGHLVAMRVLSAG